MNLGRWVIVAGTLGLSGCMTMQAYEGRRLPADEIARVQGDYKVRAGAPMSLLLRQVNGQTVDMRFSAVDVLPGPHTLLVDCVMDGTTASRHRLEVDLVADRRYVITAETTPGNRECTDVRLLIAY